MQPLYVYTLFDDKSGRPKITGIKDGDKVIITDLFAGKGGNILKILKKIQKIAQVITQSERQRPIVISDYKRHIKQFELPISSRSLNIYDLHLPNLPAAQSPEAIRAILEKMASRQLKPYQQVIANAAVTYFALEERGIEIGYTPAYPTWDMGTFSGRSRTTGLNIQGYYEPDFVRAPGYGERDVIIHFDWICADIRIASILSGDTTLQQTFQSGDPYEYVMQQINADSEDKLTREECKLLLLKSINSMDWNSLVFTDIYHKLGSWIYNCQKKANEGGLQTILGRKFTLAKAKNELAVLNGVMQGSVAHAMQCAIRRVWEKLPRSIVAEIHDSMVVCSHNEPAEILSTITAVSDIMLHPFEGILPDNPSFPVKISVGKRWRQWKPWAVKRELGKLDKFDKYVEIKQQEIPPEVDETVATLDSVPLDDFEQYQQTAQ